MTKKVLIGFLLLAAGFTALANLNVTRLAQRRAAKRDNPPPLMAPQANDMKQYTSAEQVNLGETRQAIVVAPDGTLIDKSGSVVSYADSVAIDVASSNVIAISDAAMGGVSNAMQRLYNSTNLIADAAFLLRLVVPPMDDREAPCAFVVDVESDGTNDIFWVWYNKILEVFPNREQTYCLLGETNAIKGVWWDLWDGHSYGNWRKTYNSTDPKRDVAKPVFNGTDAWVCAAQDGGDDIVCAGNEYSTSLVATNLSGSGYIVWDRFPQTSRGYRKEGMTLVRGNRTWEHVHCSKVARPDFARGLPCQHKRNDSWGLGKAGFIFGAMTPLVEDKVPYTGFITNKFTGEVRFYFKDGFNTRPPNATTAE